MITTLEISIRKILGRYYYARKQISYLFLTFLLLTAELGHGVLIQNLFGSLKCRGREEASGKCYPRDVYTKKWCTKTAVKGILPGRCTSSCVNLALSGTDKRYWCLTANGQR